MASEIVVESKTEALECLYAIESIAQLMQKAHEHLDESTTGIYGSAVIVERNAKRLMELLGEA
jgi:hypothetical protein